MKQKIIFTLLILLAVGKNAFAQDANKLLEKSRIEVKKGNYDKALELCNKSIPLQDQGSIWMSYLERGKIYFLSGKYKEATLDFEKCFNEMRQGMYTSENFEMCGDAYEKMGQKTKACEMYRAALYHTDVFEPSETAIQKLKEKCDN